MLFAKPPYHLKRIVRRTVVYQKDIVFILRHGLHFFFYLCNHMRKRMLRTVTGNDKAYLFHIYILTSIFVAHFNGAFIPHAQPPSIPHGRHPDDIPVFTVYTDVSLQEALPDKAGLFIAAYRLKIF